MPNRSNLYLYAVYPENPNRAFQLIAVRENEDLHKIIVKYGIKAGKIIKVSDVSELKRKQLNKQQRN